MSADIFNRTKVSEDQQFFFVFLSLIYLSETISERTFQNLAIMTTMTFCMSPINAESKVEMEEEEEVSIGTNINQTERYYHHNDCVGHYRKLL